MRNLIPWLVLSAFVLATACSPASESNTIRGFYTDQEVEAFIERFPSLANPLDDDRPPREILQLLGIDTADLELIDSYIGDCPTLNVYAFSPSYDLVVDDNACIGYEVFFKERE